MEVEKRAKTREDDEEIWVFDSSLDHKGRVPLRDRTGAWKASLFIIAIEFSERLSYFGIATSLIIYLTKVIHQDVKTAAKNVNYWSGLTTSMPLLGGFLADAYLGRFITVLLSSIIYLLALILLTMSQFVPTLKACNETQCDKASKIHEVVFFLAIYLISAGTGGHKPSLESFGADQFDDNHCEERKKKMTFFNWWNLGLCCGLLLGVTVIVYIQDHVNWGVADSVLTLVMAISLAIFLIGRPFYRYRATSGSPFTPMLQVLVAAIRKRNLHCPLNSDQLHELPNSSMVGGRLLCHTKKLMFLDKAAIIENTENSSGKTTPWRLATVTQVEELKLLLNMIPIWLSTLPFGICVAQTSTFFIKQATMLNRNIGNNFMIPSASVYALSAIGTIISVATYEKLLIPMLRKARGNERGITILQRIGIGIGFCIISMIIATLVENKRLNFVNNKPLNGSFSMSVFWLAPQYLIVGIGDGFALVGLQEFFYGQVPDSMRSLGIAFYLSVIGAGNFLSSILITVVDGVSEKYGKSWFGKDLNSSRLDLFYGLLAVMTGASLIVYVFLARRYPYKNVQGNESVA
ncbi:protein NRT1/ PTR FAMILY 5.7-like [Mercurialis annua]|uniref:protein NRT1/ PTR FAMILY 5.7-like n=1 Tax=Mercurialis annua TaxID=3986 RepID=UPI00215F2A50|nr:protein NRT1/ PTR FAMILY 5.7-like [Mercurialis annua]